MTIKEIIIAPFGRVRFRDFFFADVVTSMPTTLNDIGYSFYFITNPDSYKKDKPANFDIKSLYIYIRIVSILPFWFRFW